MDKNLLLQFGRTEQGDGCVVFNGLNKPNKQFASYCRVLGVPSKLVVTDLGVGIVPEKEEGFESLRDDIGEFFVLPVRPIQAPISVKKTIPVADVLSMIIDK